MRNRPPVLRTVFFVLGKVLFKKMSQRNGSVIQRNKKNGGIKMRLDAHKKIPLLRNPKLSEIYFIIRAKLSQGLCQTKAVQGFQATPSPEQENLRFPCRQ